MSDDDEKVTETIGALYDRLPVGVWTELPEYGIRVKRVPTASETEAEEGADGHR